jgi:CBS domain-containing protein
MQISDILTRKGSAVTSVQETDTIGAIVALLAEKRVGAVVVLDPRQKMAGIFSERDLVNALAKRGPEILNLPVRDLMTRHVLTCTPEDKIDTVLARMTANRIRHLPVLQNTQIAGIVSIGDLVLQRLNEKELEAGVLLDLSRMRAG